MDVKKYDELAADLNHIGYALAGDDEPGAERLRLAKLAAVRVSAWLGSRALTEMSFVGDMAVIDRALIAAGQASARLFDGKADEDDCSAKWRGRFREQARAAQLKLREHLETLSRAGALAMTAVVEVAHDLPEAG